MASEEAVKLSDIIGTNGKYQTVIFVISFYSWWFIGTAVVTVELMAPRLDIYWDWDANNTNRTVFSSNDCSMEDILHLNRTSSLSNSQSRLIYETPYSRRTLTEELDLVCERSWLVSFANFMCMMGICAGNILLNLSERYGRRRFIIFVAVLSVIVGVCMTFTKGYVTFAICTFLYRASANQTAVLLFIQAVEIATPSWAPYVGIFSKSGLLVGQTILVSVAWILKNWFHTQIFLTALCFGYLTVIWYVQESPTWLAVRGRYEEARKVLVTIVRRNGRKLEEAEPKIDAWLEQMKVKCEVESKAEKGTIKDLFKNRRIALYTCTMAFQLTSCSFVYTGLVMNTENFGSGLYVDLTLSNGFSLASVLFAGFLLRKVSVRNLLISFFVLEGVACFAYPLSFKFALARTVISVLGRLFISPVAAICMVYVSQVFPTSVRAAGTGFVSIISGLLSSPSPFTKELGEVTSVYVPFILFAVLSLATAVAYRLMPETRGKPMPHTVHDLKIKGKEDEGSAVVTISIRVQEA